MPVRIMATMTSPSPKPPSFKLAVGGAIWLGLTWLAYALFLVNTPITLQSVQAGAITMARGAVMASTAMALLAMIAGLIKLALLKRRDASLVIAAIWSMGALSLAFSIYMLTRPLLDSAI